jgi:SAM-dependent methyltransferase
MTEQIIIGLTDWLGTTAGAYVLQWEQAHLDIVVADLFGFHALQLGLPELHALRSNRMPHRWLAVDARAVQLASGKTLDSAATAVALQCDFDALPFDSGSLDLVVLPHTLELARDPHQALREVERVLMPEGRVVITGFNPASLWGLRQSVGLWRRRLQSNVASNPFLPSAGEPMRFGRLRDWLQLLSFEVETGRFGCFRPPVGSEKWLTHFEWMEAVGARWWPVFGAVYFVVAVKRVRGMRLVGLDRSKRTVPRAAPVVASHHHLGNKKYEHSR